MSNDCPCGDGVVPALRSPSLFLLLLLKSATTFRDSTDCLMILYFFGRHLKSSTNGILRDNKPKSIKRHAGWQKSAVSWPMTTPLTR
jgi:hypothetical protein